VKRRLDSNRNHESWAFKKFDSNRDEEDFHRNWAILMNPTSPDESQLLQKVEFSFRDSRIRICNSRVPGLDLNSDHESILFDPIQGWILGLAESLDSTWIVISNRIWIRESNPYRKVQFDLTWKDVRILHPYLTDKEHNTVGAAKCDNFRTSW